jgi:hypothetical protein
MTAPDRHLPSMTLDALTMGVLAGDEAARAQAHLQGCAHCREELEGVQAAHDRFRREVFPRTLPQLEARRAPKRAWTWLFAPVLAGAAALLFLAVRPHPPAEPELGIKGGPTLTLFARRGESVFAVGPGVRLHGGDQLRFRMTGSGNLPYVIIGSIDSAGTASIYYPFGGSQSAKLDGPVTDLPGSVILDATPGPERIFAVVSKTPLRASDLTGQLAQIKGDAAIRQQRTLHLPKDAAQVSVVLEKDKP